MSPSHSVTSVVADSITGKVLVSVEEPVEASFAYPPKASANPSSRVWMQTDLHDNSLPVPSSFAYSMPERTRRFSSNVRVGTKAELAPSTPVNATQDDIRLINSAEQIARFKRTGMIHFATLCWCLYLEGWNDGTTGPLLPVIQRDFGVGFAVVSLLFVSNCIGFISGAAANVWLDDRFGFGKVIVFGTAPTADRGSVINNQSRRSVPASDIRDPGSPTAVPRNGPGQFLRGLRALSLQNSQANGFVGALKENVPLKLGLLHASYGLGAFSAPLVSTQFSEMRHWSYHYIISAGMAVSNIFLLTATFRFKRQDDLLAEAGQETTEVTVHEENKYKQIFGIKKVTLGGWIVTFIINERDGGPSAGYISSGFFGGLTLGRVGLLWFNKLVGERRVLFVYGILAIVLEITIWVVPSIIQNAVAVSFIGVLLGPMFPIIINYASHIFPRWLLTACVGWITGIGMAGSAALPFITGLLASRYGIGSLQPLMVSMMCTMVGVWALVPSVQRRVD
ncbi:Major Facilitator Superfamily Transporter [Pleurotus pulmonarius]